MEHLTPLDALFLQAEDSDPRASLNTGAAVILEGPAPSHREFLEAVSSRLEAVPHARQIVRGFPFDLGAPGWVDDPHFDMAHHIRRTVLPAPGNDAALYRLIGRFMTARLDREHAMWECWVVEGLEKGRWAILAKMHHCMADGVSGARLLESLCDYEEGARIVAIAAPETQPSNRSLSDVLLEVVEVALSPRRQVMFAMRQLKGSVRWTWTSLQILRELAQYGSNLFSGSSSRVLTGHLGHPHSFAAARTSLDDVRLITDTFRTTVNHVALTAIAGALRKTLIRSGEAPTPDSVRPLVPLSVRTGDGLHASDSRVPIMVPYLPVDIADPVARLLAVHDRLATHQSPADARQAITTIAERWPFAPVAWTVRMTARLPQPTIVSIATNVPGPREPRKLLGRRMVEVLPFAPIAMRLRLSIAIFSYSDRMTFAVDADTGTAPDVAAIAASISEEIALLTDAARRVQQRRTTQERRYEHSTT